MGNKDIVQICEKVLTRLSKLGYEKDLVETTERLIFPNKEQAKGDIKRISEQELRQLFIDEFKGRYNKKHNKLYYSIETPTVKKYSFGTKYEEIEVNEKGQSALLDMCVFKRGNNEFERVLNIEFKHKNATLKNIAKDILKLMHEKQNGAFVLLLKNTDTGTLCNSNERGKGVFNKFKESFEKFKNDWKGESDKYLQLIIMSLEQKTLIHHEIKEKDNLVDIFSFEDKFGNIKDVKGNGWQTTDVEVEKELGMVAEDNVKYGEV